MTPERLEEELLGMVDYMREGINYSTDENNEWWAINADFLEYAMTKVSLPAFLEHLFLKQWKGGE